MLCAFLLASPDHATLRHILDNPKLDGAVVSAMVVDLDGHPLFEYNSGTHMVPASNQKLLSNSFALWQLGPDFRPVTRFWKLRDRTVVESFGDPLLTHEQLVALREKMRLDRSLPVHVWESYAPGVPESWEIDDLADKYAAPVSAFTVDRGSFELWSDKGRSTLLPESYGVRIERGSTQGKLKFRYDPFARRVWVSGPLPTERRRLDTYALPKSDEAAALVLGSRFVRATEVPLAKPDEVLTGSTVLEMVQACLPPSDNNIAENLLLMASQHESPVDENPYVTARARLEQFLTRTVGLLPGDVHVYDGSGMSRHNYVTTRGIAKLLVWGSHQPTAPVWRDAFAKAGKGTLSSRLKGIEFEGKTGSLDMVSSLSGYLTRPDGKQLVVSLIVNEFACTSGDVKGIEDEFVRFLSSEKA